MIGCWNFCHQIQRNTLETRIHARAHTLMDELVLLCNRTLAVAIVEEVKGITPEARRVEKIAMTTALHALFKICAREVQSALPPDGNTMMRALSEHLQKAAVMMDVEKPSNPGGN